MNDHFELFGNNSIRIAVVGVLCILALFLFTETLAAVSGIANPTNPPADTITVSGAGQVSLAPDIAHLTFTAQNSAATVAAAQAATTKQANAAIAAVKQQGIAAADITTLSYTITPQYSNVYPPCPPGSACPNYVINGGTQEITGYQVAETIQITVRDLDNVSPLLAALGKQNVQDLSGPDFALSTPDAGQEAARAAAIADAKSQAEVLAKQLGVSLGKIVNFSEGGAPYPVSYAMSASTGGVASAPAPEVPAGENTYSDSVSITYAIH